jgi:hypothetical protein
MALEKELALLNQSSHDADRAQGNDQFMRELALREYDLNNAWDYKWSGF